MAAAILGVLRFYRLLSERQVGIFGQPLVEQGYTVFSVNHRATPRFRFPAPLEDVQRAVRFIRYHAADYAIDPNRIGAVGGSSGGHLVSMLAVLDGSGDPDDPDPINRVSAKVQTVVARAAPSDLAKIETVSGTGLIALLMGTLPSPDPQSSEALAYREASPINYVSANDPPILLIHGDADETIPHDQSLLSSRRTLGLRESRLDSLPSEELGGGWSDHGQQ
jgi:acetyl esterase/lipase